MKKKLRSIEPYIWILPSVLLMAVFIVVPIGFVFRMSFSKISKAGLIKGFCGFDNFQKVLGSPAFSMVLKNTIIWTITKGDPANRTDTLVTYLYKLAFYNGKQGDAAAVSVIGFLILFICASIYMISVLRKGDS